MDTALIIALIGASVSIIGWAVNYILSTSSERRRERLNFELDFTKQQLEQLYGPMVFLVLEGKRTYRDLLAVLGRDHVFIEGSPLSDQDLKVWLFWAENDFLPRNEKLIELIGSKTYLIEGSKVPDSWLAFLDHASSWKINHARWKMAGIEYSWHSQVNWPDKFESEVVAEFERLKGRYAELIGRRTR